MNYFDHNLKLFETKRTPQACPSQKALGLLPKYKVTGLVAQLWGELEVLASMALAPIGICEGWMDLEQGHLFCVLLDTGTNGTICPKFFQGAQLHKTHDTNKHTLQQANVLSAPTSVQNQAMNDDLCEGLTPCASRP